MSLDGLLACLPHGSWVGAPDPRGAGFPPLLLHGGQPSPSKVHMWGPWGLSQGSGCSGGEWVLLISRDDGKWGV